MKTQEMIDLEIEQAQIEAIERATGKKIIGRGANVYQSKVIPGFNGKESRRLRRANERKNKKLRK